MVTNLVPGCVTANSAVAMPPRRTKSQSISSDTPSTPRSPPPPSLTSSTSAQPPSSPAAATYRAITASVRGSSFQIPDGLRFPVVVLSSFVLSSLIFSVVAEVTAGDLAAISKHTESWGEIVGLLGWKAGQIAVCWFGGLDAYDTVALTLLTSTPNGLLLSLFYSIRPTTILLTTVANIISITAPFVLMRGLSPVHAPHLAAKGSVRNRSIIADPWTTTATSLLATAIFAVLLELSFATFLPVHLITHFTGVRDLTVTHRGAAGLPSLLAALVPAGYAARDFLFVSSTGAPPAADVYVFEPATSGFRQHVYHNAWGWYSPRQKELIRRSTVLAVMMVGETMVQTWGTIKGVDFWGAVCYAAIWGVGVAVVGAVFDWVGEPSG